jgi:ParB-like nuclease domain
MIRFPRYPAATRAKALAEAEEAFAKADKKRGKQKYVHLRTSEIRERLELFQPRQLSYDPRLSVDAEWVKELAKKISIQGELDPVLVIRLGTEWVCVDGHHRIAAYRLRNHKKPIKCEWFAGTPTEAVEEGYQRGLRNSLPITEADRLEEAWRRVLLEQGSRKEISQASGVGTSTIAEMRRVKKRYNEDPAFAERVGRPLLETSWGVMKLAKREDEPDSEEQDIDEKAERLARTINSKLTDKLKKDAVVTAIALAKYDPRLPLRLMDVWQGQLPVTGAARAPLTAPELEKQEEILLRRAYAFKNEAYQRRQEASKSLKKAEEKRSKQEEWNRKLQGRGPERRSSRVRVCRKDV